MSFITSTRRSSSVGLSSTSGDEVTVTVAVLSRLGMHQRSPTANVVGGASRATMSRSQRRGKAPTFLSDIDAEPEQRDRIG